MGLSFKMRAKPPRARLTKKLVTTSGGGPAGPMRTSGDVWEIGESGWCAGSVDSAWIGIFLRNNRF